MAKNITRNMLTALKTLYTTPEHKALVHYSTAFALEDRGLVGFDDPVRYPTMTQGGNFPHYLVYLTEDGRAFCAERFGKAQTTLER